MRNRPLYCAVLLALSAAQSSAQTNPEVFVSVSRSADPVQSAPVDARVIEKKEIERLKPRDPSDLLKHLPSVSIRSNGAHGLALAAMRGFSSKRTAVVVDDMKLPTDITGTVDLSILPVSGIERIEVLPGGWSPLYGANAEGGVIHLISPDLRPGARVTKVESEFSSYQGRFNRVEAGFAEEGGSVLVTGSNEYSDGFQQNSAFVKNSVTGVFSKRLHPGGKLTLRAFESSSRTGLPSGSTERVIADWNGEKEKSANRLDDYQKSERNLVNGAYDLETQGGLRLNLSGGVSNNVINALQYGSMTRITVHNRALSAKLGLRDSVIGVDYDRGRLTSDFYGRHSRRTYALFGQRVLRPAEHLEVTPAARLDDYTRSGGAAFSPGLSVVYSPDFAWKFSARAAKAFQPPTFADLYNPFVPAADVSPDLDPERSINYQAGGRWNSACGFYTGLSGYYSLIHDRIALDANRSYAAYNLENAFTRGVETELGYKSGRAGIAGAYTYNQSKGRLSGDRYRTLDFSPPHRASLLANFDAGPAGLLGRARYVSKQYSGRGHSGLRLPDFVTADLYISGKIGAFELSAGADNILDRHYAENAGTTEGYFPQPGRVWRFSVKAAL